MRLKIKRRIATLLTLAIFAGISLTANAATVSVCEASIGGTDAKVSANANIVYNSAVKKYVYASSGSLSGSNIGAATGAKIVVSGITSRSKDLTEYDRVLTAVGGTSSSSDSSKSITVTVYLGGKSDTKKATASK